LSIKSRLFILCVFELSFTHFTSYSNLHYTYRCEQRFSTVFGMKTKKRNRLEMSSVATIVLSQTKPRKKEAGTGKTVPTVALINDNRRIVIIVGHFLPFNWVCNRNKWTFLWKILLLVCDWGWESRPNVGERFWVTGAKRLGNTVLQPRKLDTRKLAQYELRATTLECNAGYSVVWI